MSDPDQPPAPADLIELIEDGDHEEARVCLDRLDAADPETRKQVLRAIRDIVEEHASPFAELASPLVTFLTDDDRAVRLTTAKLFVSLARSEPRVVEPVVDGLADRLADDKEFYYVRARCAEALGYVAVDAPDAVTAPALLADLRIGLTFDEPEVKTKLAKAIAHVAVGNPRRLRHHVGDLATHLDSDDELVRYHLSTALVAVGCESPDALAAVADALRDRADDPDPYVRGRAAEALGLLGRSDGDISLPEG